jgi:hypothetical protein
MDSDLSKQARQQRWWQLTPEEAADNISLQAAPVNVLNVDAKRIAPQLAF